MIRGVPLELESTLKGGALAGMTPKQELGQSRSGGKRESSPLAEEQRWGRRLERVAGPTVLRVLDGMLRQGLGGETSEAAAQGS